MLPNFKLNSHLRAYLHLAAVCYLLILNNLCLIAVYLNSRKLMEEIINYLLSFWKRAKVNLHQEELFSCQRVSFRASFCIDPFFALSLIVFSLQTTTLLTINLLEWKVGCKNVYFSSWLFYVLIQYVLIMVEEKISKIVTRFIKPWN